MISRKIAKWARKDLILFLCGLASLEGFLNFLCVPLEGSEKLCVPVGSGLSRLGGDDLNGEVRIALVENGL